VKDPTAQLRFATRRAKSDVANKLISMFLHEFSRKISETWKIKVDGKEYEELVRKWFDNRCPYCGCNLAETISVIEHLDGMNRYRAGLHAPGNVLVACRRCNCEKRRDDSLKVLLLAKSGWESFLCHEGNRCAEGLPNMYLLENHLERRDRAKAAIKRKFAKNSRLSWRIPGISAGFPDPFGHAAKVVDETLL
jgi:hypothetical protein